MDSYGQGRQIMDATWEYSSLLPQVTQELLAPSNSCSALAYLCMLGLALCHIEINDKSGE